MFKDDRKRASEKRAGSGHIRTVPLWLFAIAVPIAAFAGFRIAKPASESPDEPIQRNKRVDSQNQGTHDKTDVLDSMAEIYDNVNLISFVDNTEMSLRDVEKKKHGIDMSAQTHTLMNQRLKNSVVADQLDDFLTFTNITTVRERLKGKKIISADFIDVNAGWFRAQYITVVQAPDGRPDVVIYTTRNVDEEKRREEHLIRLSITDELTGLYNRRCYVDDLGALRDEKLDDDLVVFSVDINGLKTVNDTKGHAAGDELIQGAAESLLHSIGQNDKAYRTGGDEFMAIVRTDEPERMSESIRDKARAWRGEYGSELSLAVGFAAHAACPGATIDELGRLADSAMYDEKERFYRESGNDRRRPRQSQQPENSD